MTISRIAFIGDSLYDGDEFWRLASNILVDPLPDPQYYDGRFSDGEVQTQVMARLLGYEYGPPGSEQDYNYAVGGARAIGPLTAGDFVDDEHQLLPDAGDWLDVRIDLTAQTERFLADAAANGWDLSTFAVNMIGGINDLSNWEPESIWPWEWDNEIDQLVEDIVDVLRTNVQMMLDAGVGEVWVANQADETFFPIYNDLDEITEFLSNGVIDDLNDQIIDMVASFNDPRVHVIELEEVTDAIEEDPLNFGIVDLETSILLGKGGDYDPELNPDLPAGFDFATDVDEYGFLDRVHPTAHTHRILGIYQAEVMSSNWTPGSTSNDTFVGTNDDDLIVGVQGDDLLKMRDGDDVALGGSDEDQLIGHAGSDLLSGGAGNDIVEGRRDNDLITGGFGNDTVLGGDGHDVLIDTAGSDTLQGDGGDDFLLWFDTDHQGPDTIAGGNGSDTLIFYIADTTTYDAAVAEYGALTSGNGNGNGGTKGKGKKATESSDGPLVLDSLGVTLSDTIETVQFVDLSQDGLELPDTGDADLALRLEEWLHWDFA